MTDATLKIDPAALSFEESLKRLEEIVSTLEGGRADLATSLLRYEEGIRLLRLCRLKLDDAERRIEMVKKIDADGNFVVETIDAEQLKSDESTPGRQTEKSAPAKKSTPKAKKSQEPAEKSFPAAPSSANAAEKSVENVEISPADSEKAPLPTESPDNFPKKESFFNFDEL